MESASFICVWSEYCIPSELLKQLDLKEGEFIEITITKVHVEKAIKKELANRLSQVFC